MRIALFALIVGVGLLVGCSIPAAFNYTAQYQNDTTAISAYLKQHNIHAAKLSWGVWVIVDSVSEGVRGTFNDSIYVDYKMRLMNTGTITDQSTQSTRFTLSGLIWGVQVGMPHFPKGSKGRIFIPSYYGYQNIDRGSIPANSNLIFEFRLNDVKDSQFRKDTVTVAQYLRDHQISAATHPSGVRYTTDIAGAGIKPTLRDSVTVSFTTKLLSDGTIAEQSNSTRFLLTDLMVGWSATLADVKEGSTVTMYIPSSLGYGAYYNQTHTISPGSNLLCTVSIIKVHPH